jgi:hypothetical protein
MDFPKFVQMLEFRSLWFSRADKFDDPFEGTLTDGEIKYRQSYSGRSNLSSAVYLSALEDMTRTLKFTRVSSYVNCWRMGSEESMAMWDLYGRGTGLAIVSTVDRLIKQLAPHPELFTLASVKYIDWESADPPSGDRLEYLARKDKSYTHEAEMRAIFVDTQISPPTVSDKRKPTELDAEIERMSHSLPSGKSVAIDPQQLITRIMVGPREKPWMADLVKKMIERYGLTTPVRNSDRLQARKQTYDLKEFARPGIYRSSMDV